MRISDWSSDVFSSDLANEGNFGNNWKPKPAATRFRDAAQPPSTRASKGFAAGRVRSAGPRNLDRGRQPQAGLYRRIGGQVHRVHLAPEVRQASDRSEEHTSELQSLMRISYAVFCLK